MTTTLAKAVFKIFLNHSTETEFTIFVVIELSTTYKLIITVQVFGAEPGEEMLAVGYGEKD